ncbi:MAG: hypothetical protein RQ862_11655, partial [Candidatus Caldarchaeales archaeon]|nr:hypothetical protein [Candidatus Caldarchaeales archaeon]
RKEKAPFRGALGRGKRRPPAASPAKGLRKIITEIKQKKRVTQLGAGMNPSKLTNPQFFS